MDISVIPVEDNIIAHGDERKDRFRKTSKED